MTKDPNFVSVRLPDDVANWLRDYATANKMVRADKPNMGGSIIAVIRSVISGQTISNNVGQSSAAPDVDIQTMIDDALNSKISEMRNEINDLKSTVNTVTKEFARYRDLEIDDLTARVVALETASSEATAPANFTSALLQRAKEVAPLKLKEVA